MNTDSYKVRESNFAIRNGRFCYLNTNVVRIRLGKSICFFCCYSCVSFVVIYVLDINVRNKVTASSFEIMTAQREGLLRQPLGEDY